MKKEVILEQVDVIEFEDLDSLSEYYEKFDNIFKNFKKAKGDNFEYDIDIDYENTTLKCELRIKTEVEEDDNSERDPQYN